MPTRYSSAGQKRDESGVSISSISTSLPVVVGAELELGVGDDDAALAAYSRGEVVERGCVTSRTCSASSAPISFADLVEADVLVVLPGRRPWSTGVKIGSRQLLGLLQARRQRDAAHRAASS